MHRIHSVAKYQIADNRNGVLVYYAVLIGLALIMVATPNWNSTGTTSLSGVSSMIFIFVLGLNCFRSSFLFCQANNISRRSFYFATILSLLVLAVILSLCDLVLDAVLGRYPFYEGFFEQIYPASGFAKILWTTALFTFSASLGWMITMIYYRANPWVKVLVSISPIVVITLAGYLHQRTDGVFGYALFVLLGKALGFSAQGPNLYPAMATFVLASMAIWAVNYLLMRKTPVRPY
jgi:hypothetical protein